MIRKALLLSFLFAAFIMVGATPHPIRIGCNVTPTVTPNHAIVVACWAPNDEKPSLHADLSPVSIERALQEYDYVADVQRAPVVPIATATFAPASDGSTNPYWVPYAATFFPPAPGAYDVRIYDGDELVNTELSTVSRFGLLSLSAASESLYAPIDLESFRVHRGALDVARVTGGARTPLHASADGLYEDTGAGIPQNGYPLAYARGSDGSIAFTRDYRYGAGQAQAVRYYVQTDRPVYRPGDTVHVRAIAREGTIGKYSIGHAPIVVDVSSGYSNHPIARRTLTPDEFGSIATSVQLPADAQLGGYSIMVGGQYLANFDVEAYKKPEYTLAVTPVQPYVVDGDAAQFKVHLTYLFGASAANLALSYRVYISYGSSGWYGPFAARRNAHYESDNVTGDATTDSNGDAIILVPTKSYHLAGAISLNIDARDASGRTVSQSSNLSIVSGTFQIRLEPSSWVGQAAVPSTVLVHTLTHEGAPRPGIAMHVRIFESHWEHEKYSAIERGTLDVRTDAKGEARFAYTPPESGEFVFDASATDERGNEVTAQQYQWVFSKGSSWIPPLDQPRLISNKSFFAPGETLRATLVLVHHASQAIVTLSTDRLVEHRVVSIEGTSAELAFAPPPDSQRVSVNACVPSETGVQCAQSDLYIDPAPTHLNVVVKASKASYRPGEEAHFALRVTDNRGHPVRAQLSLGVVDEGIYAINEGQRGDPGLSFYNLATYIYHDANWYAPNANPFTLHTIAKVSSRSAGALVKAGVGGDVYNVNAQGIVALGGGGDLNASYSAIALNGVPVRRAFADTAFWTPSVVTDAHGRANVTFTWPENLTTWRASAVAVTIATQLGGGQTDTLVSKPLLVRLETPRFLRAHDVATITGIVHGAQPGTSVHMLFNAGPLAHDTAVITRTLDAGRQTSATWPVSAGYVGSVDLTLRATDGLDSDGMLLPLPLLGAAPLEHARAAGTVDDRTTLPIVLAPGELAGALHVSFAPSMIAQLAQTLRVFDVYPYYCTEQTSSNGIVAAAMVLAGAKRQALTLPNNPKDVIQKARQRLNELRHSDGWGWWASDSTSAFMTAYAVYAQVLMDRALNPKYTFDAQASSQALVPLMQDTQANDDDVAFAAYALTLAKPGALPAAIVKRLDNGLGRADALTVAMTGLAAHEDGREATAQRAAQRLLRLSDANGGTRWWHEKEWSWRWWSDPIEETAMASLLLHETGHESEAQEGLAFIRAQRNGDWWYTTLDTAMASIAIAQIEGPDAATVPDETARVLVDGRAVATVRVTSLLPDASDMHVVIPPALMHDAHTVTIERSGTGRLYWSTDFEKYAAVNATTTHNASDAVLERLFARAPALSVNRRYTVAHPGAWRVGDEVTVDLWITARDGAQYVTFEDPFPAGTEYQPMQGQGGASWSGEQFLDDRAAFFLYWLAPGQTEHLQYQLRATTPGTFTAPGPSAFASYGPPITAVGTGEQVVVDP